MLLINKQFRDGQKKKHILIAGGKGVGGVL